MIYESPDKGKTVYERKIGDFDNRYELKAKYEEKQPSGEMTVQYKAQELYTKAYSRWCFELSHEKNYITAKDIAINICNEVLGYMGADRGYEFWTEVKGILTKSNHQQLYKNQVSCKQNLQI